MSRRRDFLTRFAAAVVVPLIPTAPPPANQPIAFVPPARNIARPPNDLSHPLTYEKIRTFVISGCCALNETMVEVIDTAAVLGVWEASMLVGKIASNPSRDPSEPGVEIRHAADRYIRRLGWPLFEEHLHRCNLMPEVAWRLFVYEFDRLRRSFVYEDRFWGEYHFVRSAPAAERS